MKIKFCGAAQEVTGSKHLLEINGKKILLDCGLFQGHRKEADVKNHEWCFNPWEIDAMILSHAHIDHSGSIPLLVKNGFKGKIYTTFASRDLCNYMLMDSAFIQEKDVEYMLKKMSKKKQGEKPVEPLYTSEDARKALEHFCGMNYNQPFEVVPGVKCTFYNSGHILGSALTYLEFQDNETGEKMRFGFTGDLGRKNLPILKDPEILPPTDVLLMENTYGDRFHESMLDAANRLAEAINRTVKRGGKIIIPAFAVERTQELIYHLNLLWQKQLIPDLPIYVDSPLAANVTEVFRGHPECFDKETYDEFVLNHKNPFGFGRLVYTRDSSESKELNQLKGPAIIMSASGMCENGRILHHLKNNVEDPKNTILIVGFMAKDTLGRKILEKQPIVKIFNEPYHLRAEVLQLDAFSGHADRSDLLDYVARVKDLKKIILVHGEEEQSNKFKEVLAETGFKDVYQPARGEVLEF